MHGAVSFLLFVSITADTHSPVHHAKTTVGEYFDIETENAWVKFSSPVKVDNRVTSGSAVRSGWKILALES